MYRQVLDPVAHSLAWSSLVAALPLLMLFVLLGVLRMRAWVASLIALAVALVVAIWAYGMPVGQALLAGTEGAAFGFFPILWIVINAIWVYPMTVETGHFDVLRRSFAAGQRRPAHPGDHHRVLVRRAAGGARRVRHAGGGHLGHAHRAGLQAAQGGRAGAHRQHRAGGVRRDGHPDHHARQGDRTCPSDTLGAMVGRQTPHPRGVRAAGAGRSSSTARGAPRDVARRAGCGVGLRRRPVRHLELHLGAAGRRRRVAGVGAAVVALVGSGAGRALGVRRRPAVVAGGAADEPTPEFAGRVANPDARARGRPGVRRRT